MEVRANGSHYRNYVLWEDKKNQPYDYERHGLLKHIMSHVIVNSKNSTLQYLLKFIEKSFIILMRYTDRLKNFKNYAYTNR